VNRERRPDDEKILSRTLYAGACEVVAMSASITEIVTLRDGSGRFEVGVMRRNYRMVLHRDQSVEQICKCIGWLRRKNARGAHIFVRPE
jgi:hypothetical protein